MEKIKFRSSDNFEVDFIALEIKNRKMEYPMKKVKKGTLEIVETVLKSDAAVNELQREQVKAILGGERVPVEPKVLNQKGANAIAWQAINSAPHDSRSLQRLPTIHDYQLTVPQAHATNNLRLTPPFPAHDSRFTKYSAPCASPSPTATPDYSRLTINSTITDSRFTINGRKATRLTPH